jgi:hypothetical protein
MLAGDATGSEVVPREGSRASAFYESAAGSARIMTLAHFPDDVLPLLQLEGLAIYEAISFLDCTDLVEMGCYDGRALEIARFTGVRYLGVDLDAEAVATLRERITREKLSGMARALVADVLRHPEWDRDLIGAKPLYVLPFNLLGNFRDVQPFLKSLSATGGAAMITVFSDSYQATEVRRAYYTRCGVHSLANRPTEDGGVLFTGDNGFYSRSYSKAAFRRLLIDSDITPVRMKSNNLAHCATVLLGPDGQA